MAPGRCGYRCVRCCGGRRLPQNKEDMLAAAGFTRCRRIRRRVLASMISILWPGEGDLRQNMKVPDLEKVN